MTDKLTALVFFVICSLGAMAQEPALSGRFIGFKLQGGDAFTIRANSFDGSVPGVDRSESHSIGGELGYGWFYNSNKSLYIGVTSAIGYSSSANNKQWNNSFGLSVQKTNYKKLYQDKLYFSLAQDLDYSYGYSRNYNGSSLRSNPQATTHFVGVSLLPGVFFRYSSQLAFITRLNLLNVQVNTTDTRGPGSTTRFAYTVFSDYTFANIQVGLVWFPSAIQPKTKQ